MTRIEKLIHKAKRVIRPDYFVCRQRDILKEPAVAGYPAGALANIAPAEFAELHGLVLRLRKGDGKRRMKKLLEQLQTPTQPAAEV